jgi:hypothetical protein
MQVLLFPFQFAAANPLTLVACVAAYMVLGMLWYGPIFGKIWARLTGMDKVHKDVMKRQMAPAIATSVLGAVVQASVLGSALNGIPYLVDTLAVTFMLWLTFTGMVFATSYAYTMKPLKLLAIDTLYPLVSWLAMSSIIFVLGMRAS